MTAESKALAKQIERLKDIIAAQDKLIAAQQDLIRTLEVGAMDTKD